MNAATMNDVNDLTPGFAYQRSKGDAADDALEMGSRLDDAIGLIEELLPRVVRAKLKTLPLLYELSFGPACWLARTDSSNLKLVAAVYEPLLRTALKGKGWYGRSLRSYARALPDCGHSIDGLLLMAFELIPDEVLPIRTSRGE